MGGRQGPPLSWSDAAGNPATAPEPPAAGSFYQAVGDFQGAHYERNAFTRGTEQELDFLVPALGLAEGDRVLDVGCGTGRHARGLAARGIEVLALDVSHGLLAAGRDLAEPGRRAGPRWVQADARALPLAAASVTAVISLCQGAFGLTPLGDRQVVGELSRVLAPGGRLALTAFSLAFAARWLAPGDAIDLRRGLVHSTAEVRGPDGARRDFDLWTACYSGPHLAALLRAAGLQLEFLSGVEPGHFGHQAPTVMHPELLALAVLP